MNYELIELIKNWIESRMNNVNVNNSNSYIKFSDIGTIQGSILGPILYALFIRPLYEIEKITTFADDNYIVSLHKKQEDCTRRT